MKIDFLQDHEVMFIESFWNRGIFLSFLFDKYEITIAMSEDRANKLMKILEEHLKIKKQRRIEDDQETVR